MQSRLVTNFHGQHYVLTKRFHWLPGVFPPYPVDFRDEYSAEMFIRSLDVEAFQWRQWVDHSNVDLRYGERAFTSAAIRELAQGHFKAYPILQDDFLRTMPKACTFQNEQDPDDEHYEYAVIPSPVALVRPVCDPVPLIIARRLLRAWAATANIEQFREMLVLLQLRYGKADAVEHLLGVVLAGLESGGVCLVRFRRRSTKSPAKELELLPFVHKPVPLAPSAPLAPPVPAPGPVSLYTPAPAQAANGSSDIKEQEYAQARQDQLEELWTEFMGIMTMSEDEWGYGLPHARASSVRYDPSYGGVAKMTMGMVGRKITIRITVGEEFFTADKIIPPEASEEQQKYLRSLSQRQLQHFALRHEVAHAQPDNRKKSNWHADREKDPGEVHATTIAHDWAKKVFAK